MKKLLLILIAAFMFTTVEAGQPFAPKAKNYKNNSYKKNKQHKKDAFVCTRTKKVNKHGLMR